MPTGRGTSAAAQDASLRVRQRSRTAEPSRCRLSNGTARRAQSAQSASRSEPISSYSSLCIGKCVLLAAPVRHSQSHPAAARIRSQVPAAGEESDFCEQSLWAMRAFGCEELADQCRRRHAVVTLLYSVCLSRLFHTQPPTPTSLFFNLHARAIQKNCEEGRSAQSICRSELLYVAKRRSLLAALSWDLRLSISVSLMSARR